MKRISVLVLATSLVGAAVLLALPTLSLAGDDASYMVKLPPGASQTAIFSRARWTVGDTVPGIYLEPPWGSRADVRADGSYADGIWTVMLTRTLATITPTQDVQFDSLATGTTFPFSVAVFDDAGGEPSTMWIQDVSSYLLGNVGTGADLEAVNETPGSAVAFTGTPMTTTGGSGASPVTLRAAYDDQNVYVLATWTDMTMTKSIRKNWWTYDGQQWSQSGNEDRVMLMWNINTSDWSGCAAYCHVGESPGHGGRMRTNNPGETVDMWHWKAARSNPMNVADDKHFVYDAPEGNLKTRKGDDGAAADHDNKNSAGTLPLYKPKSD